MTPSSSAPVVLRSRHLDKAAATALAAALETLLWPPPDAVAMVQDGAMDDCWMVEAIFAAAPDAGALEQAGLDATALAYATLPDIDWVSATLERLKPIRAGRFLLHGSHDRGRRPPAGIAIEIDAGTAFGTGHHATTMGCLLALDDLLGKQRPQADSRCRQRQRRLGDRCLSRVSCPGLGNRHRSRGSQGRAGQRPAQPLPHQGRTRHRHPVRGNPGARAL